ncbi:formyl peptide receptor 2-like [Ambystoma mexicanum]|uniref:formyl peptide receptor 2-like n=1 Tax=Ambystoma mexicanum TaxID=8296 RepID=UPI0037E70241
MKNITLMTMSLNSTLAPLSIGSSVFQQPSILPETLVEHSTYYMDDAFDDSLDFFFTSKPEVRRVSTEERSLHILSMILHSIAFLLGVTGNGTVIWIASFKMKKTVNTVWFLNLATADLVFILFLPFIIAHTALKFHWPFGNLLCKLSSSAVFLNMFASVFFLMVISIDRCVSVTMPVWSQNHRTPRFAAFIALGVWAVALIISLPIFIFRDTSVRSNGHTECYYNMGKDNVKYRTMISTRFLLGFITPFTVIVVCYVIIAVTLKKKRMAKGNKPFKIIILVIACFFICWLPYHAFSFLELYMHSNTMAAGKALTIGLPLSSSLAYFNSCINPILYVFVGRDFKEAFCTSIRTALENAFAETTALQHQSTSDTTTPMSLVDSQTQHRVPNQEDSGV